MSSVMAPSLKQTEPRVTPPSENSDGDPLYRLLQREFYVRGRSLKEVALQIPWHYDQLRRCVNGKESFPARKLRGLYRAFGYDRRVYSCLLDDTGLMIVPRPHVPPRRGPQRIIEEWMRSFGILYRVFGKVARGETLTREDELMFEKEAADAKAAIDEALEIVRQRRKEVERGKKA